MPATLHGYLLLRKPRYAKASDNDRFAVLSESEAQRIRNFADRGIRFDRSENSWQEIFARRSAARELRYGGLRLGCVACGAQRLQPRDLLALNLWIHSPRRDRPTRLRAGIAHADAPLPL